MQIHAATVISDTKTTPRINGYTYDIFSALHTASDHVYSEGVVYASSVVPAGYIGINNRILEGTTVRSSSGMVYNTTSLSNHRAPIIKYYGSGRLNAKCAVDIRNGSGYERFFSYPTAEVDRSFRMSESYKINENGETYGSIANVQCTDEEPDLIYAVGTNEEYGYVKNEDLNKTFDTPEEAVDWTLSHTEPYTIPLYDSDGETQIGEFLIDPSGI